MSQATHETVESTSTAAPASASKAHDAAAEQAAVQQAAVRTVMTQPVRFLPADLSALDALQVAREWGVHHLPVGSPDAPGGILCTCDLKEAPLNARIGDWARQPVLKVEAESSCLHAAKLMRDHVVGSLLVTQAKQVCGIVTRADLARLGGQSSEVLSASRCVCCGSMSHLRRDEFEQLLCVDCRERAEEPQNFDTGGGD